MFRIFFLGLLVTFIVPLAKGEEADTKNLVCTENPNAKEWLDLISRYGTKPIYDSYQCAGWDKMLEGVKAGNKEWLDVAKLLWKDSDAGATGDLRDSFAEALYKSPEYILKTFSEEDLSSFCGCPSLTSTEKECNELINKNIKAVISVKDESLATQKALCLGVLRKGPIFENLEK